MSDLIRRQDAIEACRSVADNINSPTDQQIGAEYCLDLIKEIPSAEPERKHGKWIYDTERVMRDGRINSQYHCSECGEQEFTLYNFCPNCGADMRGVNAKA